jgi:hypothetical protein
MRIVYKRPIPRRWMNNPKAAGVLAEADITPTPRGRLAAKLLVFDTTRSMNRFWKLAVSGNSLGRGCHGVVNGLSFVLQPRERKRGKTPPSTLCVDPRYFCVIGLCKRHLTMEVIAHESVHAGFAYEKRVKRNVFGPAAEMDEERIAYPAGAIAGAINRFLHDRKLYEKRQCT